MRFKKKGEVKTLSLVNGKRGLYFISVAIKVRFFLPMLVVLCVTAGDQTA